MSASNAYQAAGVDTAAGDLAVELMKSSVGATHGPEVLGGVGGFAGLFDASALLAFDKPVLASSTDGVGTKVAIAQAIDKHDTIGQDLVGMVVDDVVVVGARPLFMTDYIACGQVIPSRVAEIVGGIAAACVQTGTALVGGETAEHPGLLGPDDYDLAGAAVGVVEAAKVLGPQRVKDGDGVVALASSGLHANGFSLVRHILSERRIAPGDRLDEFGGIVGEVLVEPTRLYTRLLLDLLGDNLLGPSVHALSHVTGGGIAANLARVLPPGCWVEVDRSTWSPPSVFRVLSDLANSALATTETTWNLGIGMLVVVDRRAVNDVASSLTAAGVPAWPVGRVSLTRRDLDGFEHGAKGVNGGAVRLVGEYPS